MSKKIKHTAKNSANSNLIEFMRPLRSTGTKTPLNAGQAHLNPCPDTGINIAMPVIKTVQTAQTFPPAFTQAMKQYKALASQLGDEHPQAANAFIRAMRLAPDWFVEEANQMAKDMNLLPPPSGYKNGEPYYTAEDVAKHLNKPLDEVIDSIKNLERMASREQGQGIYCANAERNQ